MKLMKLLIVPLIFLFSIHELNAQKLSSIEERMNGMKKFPGYFNFYWDDVNGRIYLEIDKWDTEFLYSTSLPAGLGSNDIGLDRGRSSGGIIVSFNRVGKKIFMVQPNYEFRAITDNVQEKKAVEQSFARSTIWGFTAIAETGTRTLVDATAFFLRDAVGAAQQLRRMQQGNFIVDSSRSAIYLPSTKNFPLNTEIEATISFANNDGVVGNYVQSVTPTPNAITLRMHHSFVQLPDAGFNTRIFDPRSSFIPLSYFDYSTPVSEPIEKFHAIPSPVAEERSGRCNQRACKTNHLLPR